MQGEFWPSTGPTSDDMTTCEHSLLETRASGKSISSQEETHAKQIPALSEGMSPRMRALRVSSSGLLMRFARNAFFERTLLMCDGMHLLPGGSSEMAWNALVTLACRSDYEPAALAVVTKGSECSCSAHYPTPTATDYKGGHARRRGKQANLRDLWKEWTGQTYLPPEVSIAVQGFPFMWTKCDVLGMHFHHK